MHLSVALLSASEFARTLTSNGAGSDHGWGQHQWIIGGSVRGGHFLGAYPDSLELGVADNLLVDGRGRVLPTLPWEGVWAALRSVLAV